MALSRTAREFAAEIKNHDWSDAPYRADRAGHDRIADGKSGNVLSARETDVVRMNVTWVTAQVLGYQDPNFNVFEFAEACGVDIHTSRGALNGVISAGIRTDGKGRHAIPGTWDFEGE